MERWREQLYLEHSAKGTSWARHKYIRIEDGVYIYPEDLNKKKRSSGGDAVPASTKSNLSDWEIKIHKHIDSIVNKYPNLFGTSEQVAQNILSPRATEAFKNTLKAFTGMDPDKMSDTELNKIRKKIADYYIHGESGASGNVSSKKKSSNGKNLRNRGYSDSTDIKAGKGSNLQKGLEAGRKRVLAAIKKTK